MRTLLEHAASLREAQDMEAALDTISAAAVQYPNDPQAAFWFAQISFETWRPAAELFAKARALVPGNLDIIRNQAMALAAEGQSEVAEQLLEDCLQQTPDWLDGHRVLAVHRITSGDMDGFDRSYVQAVKADPGNGALRMMWFQQHATLKRWDRAMEILHDARAVFPDHRGLHLAALFLASESGAERDNSELFAGYEAMGDPGLDLCRVRHHLRARDYVRAAAIADRHRDGAAARMFWPYLSLCWRLMDDARAGWLDGSPLYGATFDLDFAPQELAQLADVLRDLHRMKAPYPEQSVRGGTQTDRQLFFHPHPAIQSARSKIDTAVQHYIETMPAPDTSHPLLSADRQQPRLFEGSWSVRLAGAGCHSAHTHVLGWISSAFYVTLPDGEDIGNLMLGTPPHELALPLEPYCSIKPVPGRLVLFPSTVWHATEPFAKGERMTIAFDIKIPRSS